MALGTNYKRNSDRDTRSIDARIQRAKDLSKERGISIEDAVDVVLGRKTLQQATTQTAPGRNVIFEPDKTASDGGFYFIKAGSSHRVSVPTVNLTPADLRAIADHLEAYRKLAVHDNQ